MTDQAKKLLALIRRTQALSEAMDAYLQEYPSPRVAHYLPSAAIGALQRELADIGIRAQREADRQARKVELAAERELAKWEPWQVETAKKMGFDNPADWRAYIDEREATRRQGAKPPTVEEWKAARG